jgi:hypothetical protein
VNAHFTGFVWPGRQTRHIACHITGKEYSIAYSGENDHLFRAMPITCSGMAIA